MREAAERNVKDLRAGDPEEVEQAGQRTTDERKKTKENKRERQKRKTKNKQA